MKILIAYGSTEGQTRKIAHRAGEYLRARQHDVEVIDFADLPAEFDILAFDAAIIAASVHQWQHQTEMVDFVIEHKDWLDQRLTAFISVSLSAAFEEDKAEAELYIDQFIDETGWRPRHALSLAGALRYKEYDFMRRWVMRFMASAKGASTDTTKDHEYTDWEQLNEFLDQFAADAQAEPLETA